MLLYFVPENTDDLNKKLGFSVRSPHIHSDTVIIRYQKTYDKNLNSVFEEVGEEDINQYINSFKNGASLVSILQRINLMPTKDKIAYLKQQDNVYADLSSVPTDLTEAFNLCNSLNAQYPEIFKRISSGESFDAVVSDVFKLNKKTEENKNNSIGKENITNGEAE